MICTELQKLKDRGNWSLNDLAKESGVSLSTVKRIMSGDGCDDARFDTVAALVKAMGGSLDEIAGIVPERLKDFPSEEFPAFKAYGDDRIRYEVEDGVITEVTQNEMALITHTITLYERESKNYERQIKTYEKDLKSFEKDIASKSKWIFCMAIALAVLVGILAFLAIWDVTHPTMGVVQYETLYNGMMSMIDGIM